MSLFIMFVVGAVLLGAGSMLAPALRTLQPRVSLGATLALALITGGSVWWAYAFGWDTLIVDYLLFALVSIVVLGGTLSQGQVRAEAKGETLSDEDQGWPGPGDLLFFAGVGGIFVVLVYIATLPQGNTGAVLGYLTSLARQSNQFDTFAPHFPDITLFHPPGFIALTSYLSKQLDLPIPTVQFSVAGVIGFLCMWLSFDLGAEIRNKPLGRAFAVITLCSGGVIALLLTGQYTTLMATCFALATAISVLRVVRHGSLWDAIPAGLLVGATIYADFVVGLATVMVVAVYVGWSLTRKTDRRSLRAIGAMLGALLFGLAPWLLKLPNRGEVLMLIDGVTVYGWLIIPFTFLGGLLLAQFLGRSSVVTVTLDRWRFPLVMGAAVAAVTAAWLGGQTLRGNLGLTENDFAALTWMRTNLADENTIDNLSGSVWAPAFCECISLEPPLSSLPRIQADPDYSYKRDLSSDVYQGEVLFQQGDAVVVKVSTQ